MKGTKKDKWKVYVWDKVLCDNTCGMMVAVARSIEEARGALLRECDYLPQSDLKKRPRVLQIGKRARTFVLWGGG